ncbi:MAG: hypothetical protein KGL61_04565, partial [Burkholderiales bacterium]|nr:hypothetical protein [Burkholderiales bacterium]
EKSGALIKKRIPRARRMKFPGVRTGSPSMRARGAGQSRRADLESYYAMLGASWPMRQRP